MLCGKQCSNVDDDSQGSPVGDHAATGEAEYTLKGVKKSGSCVEEQFEGETPTACSCPPPNAHVDAATRCNLLDEMSHRRRLKNWRNEREQESGGARQRWSSEKEFT